jgi:hypothetical protein
MRAFLTLALALLLPFTGPAQSTSAPPKALIDRVLHDVDMSQAVGLTLDDGYGIGIDPADSRRTDIRLQVLGRPVDLNGDGQREWLVIIASHLTCGEEGPNCSVYIYSSEKDSYRKLTPDKSGPTVGAYRTGPTISSSQLGAIKIGPARSNKWLDISLPAGRSGPGAVLKYDGQVYR